MSNRAARSLFVGAGSNVLTMLVRVVAVFILTPIILRSLGNYDYGIWEMVGSVVGYMGLMQVGFQPTVSRYTARLNATGDLDELQTVLSTAFVFLGVVGLFGLCVMVGWALTYPEGLAPEGSSAGRYAVFLVLIGLQFASNMPAYIQESLLEGLQLYGPKNAASILTTCLGVPLTIYGLDHFDPLIFLAALGLGLLLFKRLLWFAILRRVRPDVARLSVARASRKTFVELVRFSAKTFAQGLGSSIESNSPALVVGWLLGPAMVVFYRLPLALIGYVRTFSMSLTHAFMPLFSELVALGERERVKRIYLQGSKLVVGIVLPVSVGVALVGPDFIGRWAGHQYLANAQILVPLITATQMLPALNPLSSRLATAMNLHGFLAAMAVASAVVGLVLGIVLTKWIGLPGMALGVLIPMMAKGPLIMRFTSRQLGIGSLAYVRAVFLPLLPALAVEVLVVWLVRGHVDMTTYPGIIIAAVVGGAAYVCIAGLTAFSAGERTEIWQQIRQVVRRRRA